MPMIICFLLVWKGRTSGRIQTGIQEIKELINKVQFALNLSADTNLDPAN